MLGRSKLRHILSKHQQDLQKDKIAKVENTKNKNSNENENFNNNANNFTKGRSTPIITTTPFFHINKIDDAHITNLKQNKNNERAAETDYKNMEIFHRAVYPILIIGQCFAIMPVMGVSHPNPRHLRFSFKSLQMLVTLLFLPACSFLMISTLIHLLPIGINAKNLVGLVFFGCVQCACVLFLSLAPKWPSLIRYWTKTELIFTRKPYDRPKRNLAKRVRLAAAVIILLSIIEHGLFLSSAVYTFMRRTQICSQLVNTTSKVSLENYMHVNYNYVFDLMPYHTAVAVAILLINGGCTFIWNYMDLFIVMISMGIAYRFEQIAMRINKLADKEVPESVFIEIREHYVKVCELLEYIDEKFSSIILLSCMNNLYFVCYQLLNIFNKLRWPINYIYFWYSLLYLMGRTAFVFLTAASINDESKSSLSVLRRLSLKTWCIEVERLIFQMTTQTVALTGKKFYFMTRRLLFGMAGTIVTYELVLLQFDEPNRSKGLQDLCA